MCSKVLNGHIILTDTSITTILAPEMTYTPKNYSADTWFTAQNLVGENQVDWENTEPLNAITTHYPNRNTQKTILGKILKRALFDLNETYEIRYEFKTLYRKIE